MIEKTHEDMEIERKFNYHPPTDADIKKLKDVREKSKELAYVISRVVPPSREKSIAERKLEEVVMWANAAIVRG